MSAVKSASPARRKTLVRRTFTRSSAVERGALPGIEQSRFRPLADQRLQADAAFVLRVCRDSFFPSEPPGQDDQ